MSELKDNTTGLPELPEGMWWRIGEISSVDEYGNTRYGTGGWSSSYGGMVSAIQIMENQLVQKTEEIPVYGDRWWNKNKIVDYDYEIKEELEDVAVFTRLFCGYATSDEKAIPEHTYNTGSSGSIGGPIEQYHYSYHENADGARALAEMMIKEYHASALREKAWRIAEEAKKKAKDELFGDYPPKILGE